MTECSRLKSQGTVIIFGDCWPVVNAVQGVIQGQCPSRRYVQAYNIRALAGLLSSGSVAGLVLCLRPREHLFLFYALRTYLGLLPVLVVCDGDELLFTDRLILRCSGDIPVMLYARLLKMITDSRQGKRSVAGSGLPASFLAAPLPDARRNILLPVVFNSRKRLMSYLQGLAAHEREIMGVTPFQQKLLREMSGGCQSLTLLGERLHCGEKKVSYERRNVSARLGMSPGLYTLLYGALFSESVQKTPFMTPSAFDYLVSCGQDERECRQYSAAGVRCTGNSGHYHLFFF